MVENITTGKLIRIAFIFPLQKQAPNHAGRTNATYHGDTDTLANRKGEKKLKSESHNNKNEVVVFLDSASGCCNTIYMTMVVYLVSKLSYSKELPVHAQ